MCIKHVVLKCFLFYEKVKNEEGEMKNLQNEALRYDSGEMSSYQVCIFCDFSINLVHVFDDFLPLL